MNLQKGTLFRIVRRGFSSWCGTTDPSGFGTYVTILDNQISLLLDYEYLTKTNETKVMHMFEDKILYSWFDTVLLDQIFVALPRKVI